MKARDMDFVQPKPPRPKTGLRTSPDTKPAPRPGAQQAIPAMPLRRKVQRTPLTSKQARRLRWHKLLLGTQWTIITLCGVSLAHASIRQSAFIAEVTAGVLLASGLLLKIPSVHVFGMSLFCLITIPLTTLVLPDSDAPETIAICAFLLLAVGVILAIRDYYSEQKLYDSTYTKSYRFLPKKSQRN